MTREVALTPVGRLSAVQRGASEKPQRRAAAHEVYASIAALVSAIAAAGPMREAPMALVLALMSAVTDAAIDDQLSTPDPAGVRSGLAFEAMWRALAG